MSARDKAKKNYLHFDITSFPNILYSSASKLKTSTPRYKLSLASHDHAIRIMKIWWFFEIHVTRDYYLTSHTEII